MFNLKNYTILKHSFKLLGYDRQLIIWSINFQSFRFISNSFYFYFKDFLKSQLSWREYWLRRIGFRWQWSEIDRFIVIGPDWKYQVGKISIPKVEIFRRRSFKSISGRKRNSINFFCWKLFNWIINTVCRRIHFFQRMCFSFFLIENFRLRE